MSESEDLLKALPADTKQEHIEYMMLLVEKAIGGRPVLAFNKDQGWIMMSSCTCKGCKEFMESYKLEPSPTIVGAAYNYHVKLSEFICKQGGPGAKTLH